MDLHREHVTVDWDDTFVRLTAFRAAMVQVASVAPDMAYSADDEDDTRAVHELIVAHRTGLINLDHGLFDSTHRLIFRELTRLERRYDTHLITTDA